MQMVGGEGQKERKGIIPKYKNVYSQNRFHTAESTNLVHIMYVYSIIYSRTIFHKITLIVLTENFKIFMITTSEL
jgi:hypothetical protein